LAVEVNKAVKYITSNTLTSSPWQPSVFLGVIFLQPYTRQRTRPGQTYMFGPI